jgi:ABC-2 type transport system ATP-binding protein
LIETESLTKKFGDLTAVDSLDLRIDEGEIFGFLGPNGAGKTTTIRMLCCLISETSGDARIGEYGIKNREDQKKIRGMVGLLPENVGLYEEMSAYKNLDFYGRFYKRPETERRQRIEYLLKMLGLWERRDDAAATFSKGMKQKLAIARALVHEPKVLFLDEPTANLDPEASKMVRDFILELRKENTTIFLNTHMLDEAEKICDRVAILKTRLVAAGTPEQLRQSLFARTTVIQLDSVDEPILAAARRIGRANVQVAGDNKLLFEVGDPEKENPGIVHAIDAAGGRIQAVSQVNPTLEDIYLKLVRSR